MTFIDLLLSVTGLQVLGLVLDIAGACFIAADIIFHDKGTETSDELGRRSDNALKARKNTLIGLGLIVWGFILQIVALIIGNS